MMVIVIFFISKIIILTNFENRQNGPQIYFCWWFRCIIEIMSDTKEYPTFDATLANNLELRIQI